MISVRMFRPASVVRVFFNTIDLPGAGSTPTLGARLSHGFVNLLSSEWPSALVFTGTLFVYLLTVAPTLFGLDSAEFSAVAYALGVPHATGYPLYVLLGKMFTYLPFEDVAYRLNLMSAFLARPPLSWSTRRRTSFPAGPFSRWPRPGHLRSRSTSGHHRS